MHCLNPISDIGEAFKLRESLVDFRDVLGLRGSDNQESTTVVSRGSLITNLHANSEREHGFQPHAIVALRAIALYLSGAKGKGCGVIAFGHAAGVSDDIQTTAHILTHHRALYQDSVIFDLTSCLFKPLRPCGKHGVA